jgi:4-diphosphocytidyl-2-C-methyl-D-erythritol kinase
MGLFYMGNTYNIKSPGKINIGLRILSKRKDGFHNLETIFYPVSISDNIKISISRIGNNVNNITVKTVFMDKRIKQNLNNENNICFKAAKLFLYKFKLTGFKIHIDIFKNIPTGAGLGGGSSNAASVLIVLAKHFQKKSPAVAAKMKLIKKIALDLGSDVPFFLLNKPAYATGRGERLTPLPKFKIKYKFLFVLPGIHISTKWAFGRLNINKTKSKTLEKIKSFKLTEIDKFVNDFEEPVFKKYPEVKDIKQKMLRNGAVFASMSGSGSAVYGFFREHPNRNMK